MQSYEINAWCWITHPQEGDVWYPVFIRDTDYLLDGEDHPIEELKRNGYLHITHSDTM